MKLSIFYSWQSDLPNNSNRGFIEDCLKKALKNIYKSNKTISEYILDSDSRDESGTPDIVSNIFSKIDKCDIFVSDISIINKTSNQRKTSNPNVLVELGYASAILGWNNIICLFNDDYGKKEDLPFDIRFRKPIGYKTSINKPEEKKNLISILEQSIQDIIENRLSSKKYYKSVKCDVDLALQAILFDFLKFLYFSDSDQTKRFNYSKLLHMSTEEVEDEIRNKEFLGFQLFKNQELNVSEFEKFFRDPVNIHFLSEAEKNVLVKVILSLRDLKEVFNTTSLFYTVNESEEFGVVSAHSMNKDNPPNSYILLEKTNEGEGIVRDSGEFQQAHVKSLLVIHKIQNEHVHNISNVIINLTNLINDWIRRTGGVFIFNHRELE